MATYGIISDVHEDPRIVTPALELLKGKGAEKLVVNGDIGEQETPSKKAKIMWPISLIKWVNLVLRPLYSLALMKQWELMPLF